MQEENGDLLLLRIPAPTLERIHEALLAMRPDSTPMTRLSFVRYALAYVLDQLMVEGVTSYIFDVEAEPAGDG